MTNRVLYLALRSTLIGNVAIGGINFLLQIYLARSLGVEIIADYAKIVVFAQIIFLFTTYSLNHALIGVGYSVVGFQNTLSLYLIQLVIAFTVWTVIGVGVAKLYPDEFMRLVWPVALYVSGFIALNLGFALTIDLESRLDYTKLVKVRLMSFASSAVIAVLLSLIHKNVFTMVIRDFVNGVTFFGMSTLYLTERIKVRWDKDIILELISYSSSLWVVRGTSEGANRTTFALLMMFLDKHQFGLYFQIRSLVDGILVFFLNPIQTVLFSYFRSHKDQINLRRIALYLFAAVIVMGFTGCAFLYVWGGGAIGLLLGSAWEPAGVVLVPLAIYASIILYFEVVVSMCQANNVMRPIILARTCWIGSVILLVPPLAMRYQLLGGAWATAFASVVLLLVGLKLLLPRLTGSSQATKEIRP